MKKTDKKNTNDLGETRVVRAKLDHVTVYDVSESELNELERGYNSDLYLEFAVFFLSVATTLFVSLCTADFRDGVKVYFICGLYVSAGLGIVLITVWLRTRMGRGSIIKKIRQRGESHQRPETYPYIDLSALTEILTSRGYQFGTEQVNGMNEDKVKRVR